MLVLTGVLMLFVYVPSPDHAADSMYYLNQMAFGRLISGLHHWGASVMIVLVFLHMLRVFYYKAYARPRELTWIVGVLLLLLVLAMGFTGFLLPWDREGYWGTVVGVHIAEATPLVGDYVAEFLRGGAVFGTQTLSRFFALHVAALPILMVFLIVIHLRLVTKLDTAGPVRPRSPSGEGFSFYPTQTFRDIVVSLLVLAAIALLAILWPVADRPPADPGDTRYIPRPPWYFLPMFQFLKYFPGTLEPIAAVVAPSVAVLILLLMPWLDRSPKRSFLARRPLSWVVTLGVLSVVALGVIAGPNPNQPLSPLATGPVPVGAAAGRELYVSSGCTFCHGANGAGTPSGPSLYRAVAYHDREWLVEHFRDPKALVPGSQMKEFDWLSDEELNQLVDHLIQLNRENRP
jgi:ubiquinol-cytochrome c reductase cytochrome b subunit